MTTDTTLSPLAIHPQSGDNSPKTPATTSPGITQAAKAALGTQNPEASTPLSPAALPCSSADYGMKFALIEVILLKSLLMKKNSEPELSSIKTKLNNTGSSATTTIFFTKSECQTILTHIQAAVEKENSLQPMFSTLIGALKIANSISVLSPSQEKTQAAAVNAALVPSTPAFVTKKTGKEDVLPTYAATSEFKKESSTPVPKKAVPKYQTDSSDDEVPEYQPAEFSWPSAPASAGNWATQQTPNVLFPIFDDHAARYELAIDQTTAEHLRDELLPNLPQGSSLIPKIQGLFTRPNENRRPQGLRSSSFTFEPIPWYGTHKSGIINCTPTPLPNSRVEKPLMLTESERQALLGYLCDQRTLLGPNASRDALIVALAVPNAPGGWQSPIKCVEYFDVWPTRPNLPRLLGVDYRDDRVSTIAILTPTPKKDSDKKCPDAQDGIPPVQLPSSPMPEYSSSDSDDECENPISQAMELATPSVNSDSDDSLIWDDQLPPTSPLKVVWEHDDPNISGETPQLPGPADTPGADIKIVWADNDLIIPDNLPKLKPFITEQKNQKN